jgi:hypothetical protein
MHAIFMSALTAGCLLLALSMLNRLVCVCVVASIPFWETSAWRDFWQSLFYVTIKGAEKHPAENLPKIASFLVCLSSTAVPSILFACM